MPSRRITQEVVLGILSQDKPEKAISRQHPQPYLHDTLWVSCEPLPNEIRLERGGRGMVRAVGQFRWTMDRPNLSPHSRFPANRPDFGNCARVRGVDRLFPEFSLG